MNPSPLVIFQPARDAAWRTDPESGARYWSVSLPNTQLTWFEVAPASRFERHMHPSEQITAVVEGSLLFIFDDRQHLVNAGDVIAIGAGVPHAVVAGDRGARAFDAWSPPNSSYGKDKA